MFIVCGLFFMPSLDKAHYVSLIVRRAIEAVTAANRPNNGLLLLFGALPNIAAVDAVRGVEGTR